ncbi:MAG: hypothetical protein IJ088_11430 [Clostridia bacterium]|nr:hypothetical protein [Clostridia bacterium]
MSLFDAIEADFRRDYGIDLLRELDGMSWRRFLVLCRNLSPYGAVAGRIQERDRDEPPESGTEDARQAAEDFFSSVVRV